MKTQHRSSDQTYTPSTNIIQWKFTLPQQRSSIEADRPSTKIIQWKLPSLNPDDLMKTYPPSTKIIQWKFTLPQQRSSNENLPSLNTDHSIKTYPSPFHKDHPINIYPPSTKIIQWKPQELARPTKIIQSKLSLLHQRSSNEANRRSTKIIQWNHILGTDTPNKDHPMKTYPRNCHAQQRSSN